MEGKPRESLITYAEPIEVQFLPKSVDLIDFLGARPNRPVQQIVHKQYVAQTNSSRPTLPVFV